MEIKKVLTEFSTFVILVIGSAFINAMQSLITDQDSGLVIGVFVSMIAYDKVKELVKKRVTKE